MQNAPHLLSGMKFMLRCSFEILPLAITIPHFWIAGTVVLISAIIAFRYHKGAVARVPIAFLALTIFPLGILLIGVLWWEACAGRTSEWEWQFMVMYAALVLQTVLAAGLVWRHRARIWLALPFCLAATLWAAGAFFTSTMAVTGSWL